jgi:hypothetical protein
MKTTRLQRIWDRTKAEFVKVPVQYPPDSTLSCKNCRYLEKNTRRCVGVGSTYYMKKTPHLDFVPRYSECQVRLPPDLLSFEQC